MQLAKRVLNFVGKFVRTSQDKIPVDYYWPGVKERERLINLLSKSNISSSVTSQQ